jgi:hypothetical protein
MDRRAAGGYGRPRDIAAALGFTGAIERGDLVVEPTPPGYTKIAISKSAVDFRPRAQTQKLESAGKPV